MARRNGRIKFSKTTEPLLSINSQCQVDVVPGKFGKHDTDRPWEGKYDKDGRKVAPLGHVRVVLSLSSLVVSPANEPRSAETSEDRTHRPEDRVPEAVQQKA